MNSKMVCQLEKEMIFLKNSILLGQCRGDAIDLDSFCGNIISECEKTEEILMNTWFPQITAVFTDRKTVIQHKGERLSRFYKCASSLVSIQVSKPLLTLPTII